MRARQPSKIHPHYAAMCEALDDSVGLILHSDKVDERMAARNSFAHLNNMLKVLQNKPPDLSPEILHSRQQAVQELSQEVELRQRILALGRQIKTSLPKPDAFPLLMKEPNLVMGKPLLISAIHLMPLATLGATGLIFAGLHWGFPLGLLLLQTQVNRRTRKQIHRIHVLTSHNARIFRAYAQIIQEQAIELS